MRALGTFHALFFISVSMAVISVSMAVAAPPDDPGRPAMTRTVARIQRADYEGDRKGLASFAAELAPFEKSETLASRAHYWRGFALWRRAFNGFNDQTDPKELEKDLTDAVRELTEAATKDPAFVDAKVGAASCLFSLAYLAREDMPFAREFVTRGVALMAEARKSSPDNPRFLWVQGGSDWYVATARGESHAKAFGTYERGLAEARKQKGSVKDPLEPVWGEPELLMSLAWSHLNDQTPDVAAAESEARAALALVPYWHYVRDILLAQIVEAKTKGSAR